MITTTSKACATSVIAMVLFATPCKAGGPYVDGEFRGRIAYSADGNHNDPDDWIASPMSLAIFAACGLKDRVVHFDYNCILPLTDPEWEKKHADGVLGAVEHFGYDRKLFHDCRKDLDGAVNSIAEAINDSSAENPLYFIVAGPMQVPIAGIEKADPDKKKYVYCISHSSWNDGFGRGYEYTHTKRDVIASGVHWVQINEQNRLLAFGRFGTPAEPQLFEPYFWLRDSDDPKLNFLWERMVVSTRPDPSDSGMAYFLATGDEQATPEKLQRLLTDKQVPQPVTARDRIRLEAENFQHLEGYELENSGDRNVSHRLNVRQAEGGDAGLIRTRFEEPYTAAGRYDVTVRYLNGQGRRGKMYFSLNGMAESSWEAAGEGRRWTTHTVRNLEIAPGAVIAVEAQGELPRLDYVDLTRRDSTESRAPQIRPRQEIAAHPRFTASGPLDDPAALPGQIIVAGGRPGYLKINGGAPIYLCGPDNPEAFFVLGTLNADGTRSGGQQEEIIRRMADAGVNAFHCQLTRLRRCNIKDEGDDTHSPFIDHDPSKPLNEAVLDQWDGWLSQLERAGIVVHLEFYNDATDVERMGWTLDEDGELHPDERRFFEGIVNRFKHHKNIIWGIEESLNKLPRTWVPHFKKLSELIAETDEHNHPVVHSFVTEHTAERDLHPDAVMSDAFRGDPHIDIVTWLHVPPHGEDYEAQHQAYLKYALRDNNRFIPMKSETEYHRMNRTTARRQTWGCVLTGMHALESQHDASPSRNRQEWLADDGRVVTFMSQVDDWYTMRPNDELAAGSTKWVLATPGTSYIAFTYDCSGPMGVKDLPQGTYELLWFDTVDGDQVKQTVEARAGDAVWSKPSTIGDEVALSIKRARRGSR